MTRRWTDRHDAILRQLYAEGRTDADAAYILDYSATQIARHRKRLDLGPALGRPGCKKGDKRSPETRAKIAAANRRRWSENAEFRAQQLATAHERMAKARAAVKQRGSTKGMTLGPRPALAAMQRERYATDPEYRERLSRAGKASAAVRRAQAALPPKGTRERLTYEKLQKVLGTPAARAALMEGRL